MAGIAVASKPKDLTSFKPTGYAQPFSLIRARRRCRHAYSAPYTNTSGKPRLSDESNRSVPALPRATQRTGQRLLSGAAATDHSEMSHAGAINQCVLTAPSAANWPDSLPCARNIAVAKRRIREVVHVPKPKGPPPPCFAVCFRACPDVRSRRHLGSALPTANRYSLVRLPRRRVGEGAEIAGRLERQPQMRYKSSDGRMLVCSTSVGHCLC